MAPKPGNAFAQHNLQRQKVLDIQAPEADLPSTPMTTMSMFIGPESPRIETKKPSELKISSNTDAPRNTTTARYRFGKQVSTESPGAATAAAAYSAGISEHSSHSKPSEGLSYVKSRFNGKNKNKASGSSAQPSTTPAPCQRLSHTSNSAVMPNMRTRETIPEATRKTRQALPNRFIPSAISTSTTQSIMTRQSQ